jgi:hypothetical protein
MQAQRCCRLRRPPPPNRTQWLSACESQTCGRAYPSGRSFQAADGTANQQPSAAVDALARSRSILRASVGWHAWPSPLVRILPPSSRPPLARRRHATVLPCSCEYNLDRARASSPGNTLLPWIGPRLPAGFATFPSSRLGRFRVSPPRRCPWGRSPAWLPRRGPHLPSPSVDDGSWPASKPILCIHARDRATRAGCGTSTSI